MSQIKFKATRRMHDSGYRMLDKSGDLQFDLIEPSKDAIWLTITEPTRIIIDCSKDGTYNLKFNGKDMYIHNQPKKENK